MQFANPVRSELGKSYSTTRKDLGEGIFTVDGYLDAPTCASLIAHSENIGYTIATRADGVVYPDARNNDRVIVDDRSLADDLFEQARPFLPTQMEGCPLSRFNERFRFYRYEGDQTYPPNRDGSYMDFEAAEESMITFLIYLNDFEECSETHFDRLGRLHNPRSRSLVRIPTDDLVPCPDETGCDIGAHPAQTGHPNSHVSPPFSLPLFRTSSITVQRKRDPAKGVPFHRPAVCVPRSRRPEPRRGEPSPPCHGSRYPRAT